MLVYLPDVQIAQPIFYILIKMNDLIRTSVILYISAKKPIAASSRL